MKIIDFGEISIYLLYIPLTPICNAIRNLFLTLMINEGLSYHSFTFCFLMFFSEALGGLVSIYYFITGKNFDSNQKEEINTTQRQILSKNRVSIQVIKENSQVKKNYISLLILIFLFSVLDLVLTLSLGFTNFHYGLVAKDINVHSNLDFEMKTIGIIYNIIFGYLILHYFLFRHQLVSLAVIITGITLVLIPNLIYHDDLLSKLLILSITFILSSVQLTLEKKTMKSHFIAPYTLKCFEGLCGLVITALLAIFIEYCIPELVQPLGTFHQIFTEIRLSFKGVLPMYLLIVICFSSLYNIFLLMITFHYSPMHCCVSDLLSSMIVWIFFLIRGNALKTNIAFSVIGYIIILMGTLVYNEIIILYFCKLQMNTIKEISGRSVKDYLQSIKEMDDSNISENIILEDLSTI